LANKSSFGGNIRVDDFARNLNIASIVLLKERLGITNDFQLGAPVSRKQKGTSFLLDDSTNIFKKKQTLSFSSGVATLPTDYFKFDAIRNTNALEDVEVLHAGELARRLNNAIDFPSVEYPMGEFIGNTFNIYPTGITGTTTLIYYRYPTAAVFDYYINADGEIVYLPEGAAAYTLQAGEVYSDGTTSGAKNTISVELNWGDESKIDIAWLVCKYMGMNLLRGDVFQASDRIETIGK
jgi:hypothetical protein